MATAEERSNGEAGVCKSNQDGFFSTVFSTDPKPSCTIQESDLAVVPPERSSRW
jgi:hypothetical protein